MNANRTLTHVSNDAKPNELTFNKDKTFIYNFNDASVIYCGNLTFSDWSTSEVSSDEKEKYGKCINNMKNISYALPSILKY